MKKTDWTDHLASSALPSDDFTFTDGSNYGMDGFDFSQTMNEGVMDKARLPETKGLSQLPDGIVTDPEKSAADDIELEDLEDGLHLASWMDETSIDKTASLADLAWLDPTVPQDPDRLPDSPVDKGIQELTEAWGVGRRTDGLHLVPNQDKEVLDYRLSLQETVKTEVPVGQERDEIKRQAQWALRQAASGHSVKDIKQGLVARLGEKARVLQSLVACLEDERGLAGNVFIHAAAYPDIHRAQHGKQWQQHVRRLKARYVIVPEGDERLDVWKSVGKVPVTTVPWKKALAFYAPTLNSTGYRLASQGSPKEILRRAFLTGPQLPDYVPMEKPRDIRPAERVSVLEAIQKFRTAEAIPRQAIDLSDRQEEARRKAVMVQVARWTKAGYLTREDAHRLARSVVAPEMILRTATMLVKVATSAKTGAYSGVGTKYKTKQASVSKQAAWAALAQAEDAMVKNAREFEADRRMKLVPELGQMVAKGLLTKKEATRLAALDRPTEEILTLAAAAARQNHLRPVEMTASETKSYEGPILEGLALGSSKEARDFSPEEKRVLAASKDSGIKSSEFHHLLKWARIQMSEGTAGEELNQLIRLRFSQPLRKASRKLLAGLRQQHEGLSGFLYVDAGAYASAKGTTGCEKGGLQHRANGLKYVLAMDRCATCVFKNANSTCQKYSKKLVEASALPVPDPAKYKEDMLRMAGASDSEVTASLFAPGYNPGEYGLTDALSEISLEEAASNESLGDVFFGGLEL